MGKIFLSWDISPWDEEGGGWWLKWGRRTEYWLCRLCLSKVVCFKIQNPASYLNYFCAWSLWSCVPIEYAQTLCFQHGFKAEKPGMCCPGTYRSDSSVEHNLCLNPVNSSLCVPHHLGVLDNDTSVKPLFNLQVVFIIRILFCSC